MAFSQWDTSHLIKFNSSASAEFLSFYESELNNVLKQKCSEKPHQTFAPSTIRCDRISWFRLRGVEPDTNRKPDTTLEFSAEIGTACHRMIQGILKNTANWLNVAEYLKEHPTRYSYEFIQDEDSVETLVVVDDPPIRFACDGLIDWKGKTYLLEIKSSEFSSWNTLTKPKSQHIDQVKCYCELLGLNDVLFFYIDRQYGNVKCFEYTVTHADREIIRHTFLSVMEAVRSHIAPAPLPAGDSWCTSGHCPYFTKCGEYGR